MKRHYVKLLVVLAVICGVLTIGLVLYQTQAQQPKPGKEREVEVEIGDDAQAEDGPDAEAHARPRVLNRDLLITNGHKLRVESTTGETNLVVQDSGVGIGTTSPTQKLDVNGDATISGKVGIGMASPTANLHVVGSTENQFVAKFIQQNSVDGPGVYIETTDSIATNSALRITSGGTVELFRVVNNGNVGIGTLEALEKLDIRGTTKHMDVGSGGASIALGETTAGPMARISGENTFGGGGSLLFETRDSTDGNFQRWMVIRDTGNVGIWTTSPTNILTVQQNSPTDPIADAWTTYSSIRWKTNIQPIEGALEKVQRLRGVSYDGKADGQHNIGLIAEEVGEVIPEVVAYEENGQDAKSVDYARLVALLIEGMKEQQAELNGLKAKMAQLESALKKLQANSGIQRGE
ncbi:tail fiber domain-containing protein [Candidatus Poribacteria bacterium]|nr:tail fiber domain-containing protein [Candidatus Poribacteria bacterium]